mmetsp:Transcript_6628/g.11692  ORF Transcript_6628/g.11692 Transcript_6628/m.11692 type:complete len:224 (+) Transcript_6628:1758-2429(+)
MTTPMIAAISMRMIMYMMIFIHSRRLSITVITRLAEFRFVPTSSTLSLMPMICRLCCFREFSVSLPICSVSAPILSVLSRVSPLACKASLADSSLSRASGPSLPIKSTFCFRCSSTFKDCLSFRTFSRWREIFAWNWDAMLGCKLRSSISIWFSQRSASTKSDLASLMSCSGAAVVGMELTFLLALAKYLLKSFSYVLSSSDIYAPSKSSHKNPFVSKLLTLL